MFSTELLYKLNSIKRFTLKTASRAIQLLFVLASLFALGLMAFEFGYSIEDTAAEKINQGFRIITLIFFFGSLANLALHPKDLWKERGFWVEIVVLALLLFILLTQNPAHFPDHQWLHRIDHLLLHLILLLISIIQLSKVLVYTLQRRIRPELMFAYSFLILIFLGAVLLMLPKAHTGNLGFIDALFTSTSAVCITGLTTVDISSTFTLTGQVILLLLIQIGGIGVMTFTSFIALSFFTQTTFNDQMALKNILSEESMNNIFRTLLYTLFTTLMVESIGTWILWWEIRNIPPDQIPDPFFFALFHAVSAFCNAGFSTLPDNLNNIAVRHLYGFQCWISVFIIIGGIGFPIVFNYGKLFNHKLFNLIYRLSGSAKRMPSHVRIVNTTTRIVITATICLLAGGMALFWIFEKDVLTDLPLRGKLAYSFFGATTPRTAGFNVLPMNSLSTPTLILTMFLMWIGASPLSTGGGIKTTTFTIACKSIYNTLRGGKNVEIFKRQIPNENIRRAYAILFLSLLWIILASLLISITVPGSQTTQILFETISAISTVGLSLDFTSQLTTAGKMIICLTMFAGRVGLITLLTGMIHRQSTHTYLYAEDHIIL